MDIKISKKPLERTCEKNSNYLKNKSLERVLKAQCDAAKDVFKLVKNEGNLIFNFENAVDKVADHHNVNKDDLEEYFDLEIGEQTGE